MEGLVGREIEGWLGVSTMLDANVDEVRAGLGSSLGWFLGV